MMYKKIDLDLDLQKLQDEVSSLFSRKDLFIKYFGTQLGLTYENDDSVNKFSDAVGSLDYDYGKWTSEAMDAGELPPAKTRKVTEKDFNKIVPDLKGMYIYDVLTELQKKFHIGRTRLMLSKPKTCLTWHNDSTYRLHIPIFTQQGCIMVWDNCTIHMPEGSCYWVDTTQWHTAFNGSLKDRIHLVATVESKP